MIMGSGLTGEYYLKAPSRRNKTAKSGPGKTDNEADFWKRVSARAARAAKQEQRQLAEEQKARKLRRAYYARINEESALKRKLQEMENNRMYYQESVKALPLSSVYQKRVREAMASVPPAMITDQAGPGAC